MKGANPQWRYLMVGLGVIGALAGAGLGMLRTDQPHVAAVGVVEVDGPGQMLIPVHVSGWVVSPGVVWVAEGSLTVDVIDAAGGAREGARLDQVNLARPVHQGDQIDIPGPADSVDGSASPTGDDLIDINTADAAELQSLPGVGPVLAARIVAHRESVGRFESVEDLLDVPGIGETRLESIRDLIRPP